MARSPLIVIEENLEFRIQNIWEEYILEQSANYESIFTRNGVEKFSEYLLLANYKIKKKLGNHKDWIKIVLEQYYDPMYVYQLTKKIDRLTFTGTPSEVRAWITAFFEN